ncbi:MAG: FGGY-family carbohydrate kinase [Smithella sp.]|nr:FGGY-family carbohydrate kinase [Smithella sp.]
MYSLGLEFSTQSVKMVVLDVSGGGVVYTGGFSYDSTFPHYGTSGGVLLHPDASVRHAPARMFLEALDAAFLHLKNRNVEVSRIRAVKADAMQHCTVYVDDDYSRKIMKLNPGFSLLDQLGQCFTRKTSPIWEDRSTEKETAFLEEALGGKEKVISETGSRAELRFPAAQIMKWLRSCPDEYVRTGRIFLLSAFITSVLCGRLVPVDTGDGWGTNLNTCDMDSPAWSRKMIAGVSQYAGNDDYTAHVALTLPKKLGAITHYDCPAGRINAYFSAKYGLDPDTAVLVGTGDNPAILMGCGGSSVISLGSSYTVNGVMDKIIPSYSCEYNIFGYTRGHAMALSVFTNGSKVHDYFFEKYGYTASGDDAWQRYAAAAGGSLLSPREPLMLPYLMDESVPLRKSGFVYDGLTAGDAGAEIRALHVSQALALKIHSSHLNQTRSICLVGGGSRNRFMRQVLADVFGAGIFCVDNAVYAAPMGCAVSGAKHLNGLSYGEAAIKYVQGREMEECFPDNLNSTAVQCLLERYARLEKSIR